MGLNSNIGAEVGAPETTDTLGSIVVAVADQDKVKQFGVRDDVTLLQPGTLVKPSQEPLVRRLAD